MMAKSSVLLVLITLLVTVMAATDQVNAKDIIFGLGAVRGVVGGVVDGVLNITGRITCPDGYLNPNTGLSGAVVEVNCAFGRLVGTATTNADGLFTLLLDSSKAQSLPDLGDLFPPVQDVLPALLSLDDCEIRSIVPIDHDVCHTRNTLGGFNISP